MFFLIFTTSRYDSRFKDRIVELSCHFNSIGVVCFLLQLELGDKTTSNFS